MSKPWENDKDETEDTVYDIQKRKSKRSGVAKWHSACLPYVKPWIQFPAWQRAGKIKYPCANLKNKSAMIVYTYNPSTQFVCFSLKQFPIM